MKPVALALAGLVTLTSCGLPKWWNLTAEKERAISSLSVQHLTASDDLSFKEEIHQKLVYLHHYYTLAQKHLSLFDQSLSDLSLKEVYQSDAYLSLLAIRTQTEEIEHELQEIWNQSPSARGYLKRKLLLQTEIQGFADESQMQKASMENLLHRFDLVASAKLAGPTPSEAMLELKKLEGHREFQLFEKNIEHLSHVMETKIEETDKTFAPSPEKSGNISGHEFPSKVWSITFDDGPTKTSPKILKLLQSHQLSATFFQLASQVEAYPETARELKKAGMDMASHSWNHLQLTKVGAMTLDKEITQATKRIESLHGQKIRFYRLPFGDGVSVNQIRQKIADQSLIHASWNVDSLDWLPQSPDKIVARTLRLMAKTNKDAGIILFHDAHGRTALALPKILEHLKSGNRRTCSLEQIVNDMNQGSPVVCLK